MAQLHYAPSSSFASRSSHQPDGSVLVRFANTLAVWRERRRSREALAHMSEGMLKDIGLSPGEAFHEWEKPFWRA